MNDWQVKQIVLAIRAHARAMVAERLWAQAEAGTDVDHVVADADALLAALSASSGGENDAASGGDVASGVSTRSQDVSGHREPAVAPEVNPSETQAATPPLSAEAAADAAREVVVHFEHNGEPCVHGRVLWYGGRK